METPVDRSTVDEPLETAAAIAAYLNVPVSWVYAKSECFELPSLKVCHYRRFRLSEVNAWLAARRKEEQQAVRASR
jgi:DNA-binding XRE family transcriptional regulator